MICVVSCQTRSQWGQKVGRKSRLYKSQEVIDNYKPLGKLVLLKSGDPGKSSMLQWKLSHLGIYVYLKFDIIGFKIKSTQCYRVVR